MRPSDPLPVLAAPEGEAASFLSRVVAWLLGPGLQILLICVVAAIVATVASWLIKRILRTMIDSTSRLSNAAGLVARRSGHDPKSAKAAQARRSQRLETLSTVARNITRILIWSIAAVMILDRFGVNIAPVIASLGVVGLAAGIGAQTIIKDVISGILMLLEDTIAVGDYVDLEYAEGTVTGINLRVTEVRGLDGVLWTVRNGELIRVGNYSRGYSNAVVVLDIDAGADDDLVTQVLGKVTADLADDPRWADVIQSPADISGMLEVDANHYRRRVVIQTAPGQQWGIERELRGRVRDAFAEKNLSFAMPRFAETVQP
jgi:small-conductance mechanosensitive channel